MGAPRLLIMGVFRRRLLGDAVPGCEDALRVEVRVLCASLEPDVATSVVLIDVDDDAALANLANQAQPDAVALIPLTALSTEPLEPFISAARRLPFVLLARRPAVPWDGAYGLREHFAGSGQVGAAMVASLLTRHGVHFVAHAPGPLLGPVPATIELLRSAATAGRLRRLRLLRIEGPHAGYTHMELPAGCSRGEWGMTLEEAHLADLPLRDVSSAKSLAFGVSMLPGFDNDDESLRHELDVAAAVLRRCREHEIDAVAFNSARIHAVTRASSQPVLGKLALSLLGAEGIGCADTGDVLAAILLFVGKRIGGAAVYCEVNATTEGGTWHCSMTGEGDLAWLSLSRGASAALVHGQDLQEDAWTLKMNVGAGPATLIGIAVMASSDSGALLRFIALEGEAVALGDLRMARGAFSFRASAGNDSDELFARWLGWGANHHACLVDGHAAKTLGLVARLAGALIVTL